MDPSQSKKWPVTNRRFLPLVAATNSWLNGEFCWLVDLYVRVRWLKRSCRRNRHPTPWSGCRRTGVRLFGQVRCAAGQMPVMASLACGRQIAS